ncbi:MAG: Ni/Fe hydrogenase subunit alpha [Candidatus Hodarchaeales archaeon]|jgi:F420-non-reducing hydrogenase large subunit
MAHEYKNIVIDPITRLEGHGKIHLFMDNQGSIANAYFQVPELRGFERFCEGRLAEEMMRITTRICGVCPAAHHLAATKALDKVFNVEPPEPAKKLRELYYCAHMIHSHIAHFYAFAAPDFLLGPSSSPAKRNILGVIDAVGVDIGKEVIKHRSYAQQIQKMICGDAILPVGGVPGGMMKPISEEERTQIEQWAESTLEFSKFTIKTFNDVVLANETNTALVLDDGYHMKSYYMGLVDHNNHVNFYDGLIRVVSPTGNEYAKFDAQDYLNHIEEQPLPYSYLKAVYLKNIGWKGIVEGEDSGMYRVAPLARLNAADGMATPLANKEYQGMMDLLGKPAHHTLANHWARVIEQLYASERLLQLVKDPDITSKDIRAEPNEPNEGVGVVEAPRGTLFHHYKTDKKGVIKKNGVNLIVATAHNNAAICLSVKKAAKKFVKGTEVQEGMLNMVEMAFRAYDPCFACATHSLPGRMPLEVCIYDSNNNLIWRKGQYLQ